jgi:hypothetical protein
MSSRRFPPPWTRRLSPQRNSPGGERKQGQRDIEAEYFRGPLVDHQLHFLLLQLGTRALNLYFVRFFAASCAAFSAARAPARMPDMA